MERSGTVQNVPGTFCDYESEIRPFSGTVSGTLSPVVDSTRALSTEPKRFENVFLDRCFFAYILFTCVQCIMGRFTRSAAGVAFFAVLSSICLLTINVAWSVSTSRTIHCKLQNSLCLCVILLLDTSRSSSISKRRVGLPMPSGSGNLNDSEQPAPFKKRSKSATTLYSIGSAQGQAAVVVWV